MTLVIASLPVGSPTAASERLEERRPGSRARLHDLAAHVTTVPVPVGSMTSGQTTAGAASQPTFNPKEQ